MNINKFFLDDKTPKAEFANALSQSNRVKQSLKIQIKLYFLILFAARKFKAGLAARGFSGPFGPKPPKSSPFFSGKRKEKLSMTLDELYEKICHKAGEADYPEDAGAASVRLDIKGKGKTTVWMADFRGGKASIKKGEILDKTSPGHFSQLSSDPSSGLPADPFAGENPDASVSVSEETLIAIASKKKSLTMAFMTGKIKVKGDKGILGRLKQLWPA
jgi:hypothetical protein